MIDRRTELSETEAVACVFAAISVGLLVAASFLLLTVNGAKFSFWWVFPAYAIVGAVVLVMATTLLWVRRARERYLENRLEAQKAIIRPLNERAAGVTTRAADKSRAREHVGQFAFSDHLEQVSGSDIQPAPPVLDRPDARPEAHLRKKDETLFTLIHGGRIGATPKQSEDHPKRLARGIAQDRAKLTRSVQGSARLAPVNDDLVERLLRHSLQLRSEAELGSNEVVGYVGDDRSRNMAVIARWAGSRRGLVFIPTTDKASWKDAQSLMSRSDVCFVDADVMGDLEDTIDFCLQLRRSSPQTPIVLISSDVRGHDLTAERSRICDATLKPPLTERVVQIGVSVARENHSRISHDRLNPSRGH